MPEDIEKAGYDEQGPQKDKPPGTVEVLVCEWSTFNVFHKGRCGECYDEQDIYGNDSFLDHILE